MKKESIRLKTKKIGWEDLSIDDKKAIEEGLNQLNEGRFVPYSEVRKEIQSMLNTNRINYK